jgi:DNA-binding GntR family transcriptional regulator
MESMPKIKEGKLVQKAYDGLLKRIITLEFKPGEVLDEKDLERILGFGRTPIREALLLLKQDNFVEREPHKSTVVRGFGPTDIKDLFESLIILEKNLNFLAAQRISRSELEAVMEACQAVERAIDAGSQWEISSANLEFHRRITAASRNQVLLRCHENIRKQAERLSHLAYRQADRGNESLLVEHNRNVREQHREIVRCLRERDLAGMEAISIKHVHYFQEAVISFMQDVHYL